MAVGFRNPLGKSLAGMILPGDQPGNGLPPMPGPTAPPPENGGLFKSGSKGQIIAGIIGDTLASLSGGAPVFTQNLLQERQRERQRLNEEAQWTRRREADNADWRKRQQWTLDNKPPDVAPALRDAMAWQSMTEEQRNAYRQMQAAKPQFIPDGLGGGQWASAAGMPAQQQPAIGAVIPDPRKAGGPTPRASGPFRP